ncbi:MAG: porin [Geminicoccaceae bacterium]
MQLKKVLLGTTAILGAGLMTLAAPGTVSAQQVPTVSPGGALDLTLTGFIRFRASGGQIDQAQQNNDLSNGLDFSNDTEFHVVARGKSEEYGFEYGGTIEFEADTNSTLNTDETWLFLRGGFGEFRFGDDDGVVDDNKIGGATVAAGTGGIDGSIIDTTYVASVGNSVSGLVGPLNSGDATKIVYYTPDFGGFRAGVSYTPNSDSNGSNLASKQQIAQDWVEGALIYEGQFSGVGVQASAVGSGARCTRGQINGQNVSTTCSDSGWGQDLYVYGGGAALDLFGVNVAGGYFKSKLGKLEQDIVNAGVGVGFGPVNTSVTWGYVVDQDGFNYSHPWNLVFSADVGLAPGLVLAGDVGYFDNDVKCSGCADNSFTGGDKGWQAVARLGLDF